MVLEEFLDFNRHEDADTFVRFLKSRGCPATKMSRDTYTETFRIQGEIADMIAMFVEVALDKEFVSGEPPLDIDSLALHLSDPRRSSSEMSLTSDVKHSSINAFNLFLLKETRNFIADIMTRYAVGDQIATREEMDSIYTLIAEELQNDPEEEFSKSSRQALQRFGEFNCMRDNRLVTINESGVKLVKKINPETIRVMQGVPDPHMYDEDMLVKHRIILYRSILLKTCNCVALDPRVHFTCTPEEIGDALVGLAVDVKSLERVVINMNFKQYLIKRITGIVKNAKTISLDDLILEMKKDNIETEWRDCPTTIDASGDYIVGILTQMRKNKIITGSNEKMRLA